MAKQNINIGTENQGDGDSYRNAFDKTKQNFDQLFDARNITGTVTFDEPMTWVNTPDAPVTSTIQLSTSGALNAATAAVYFKGSSLQFNGGTVVIQQGNIVVDELCLVFIIYDKGSNSFHVSVMTGATGDVPTVTETSPVITVTDLGGIVETSPIITVTNPSIVETSPVITVI